MTVGSTGGGTPGSITQQLNVEDYLRLLKEAQESNQSSARVSLAGSRRDSPRSSPKSPPNSPVQGTPLNLEWQSYYMNSEAKEVSFGFWNWQIFAKANIILKSTLSVCFWSVCFFKTDMCLTNVFYQVNTMFCWCLIGFFLLLITETFQLPETMQL